MKKVKVNEKIPQSKDEIHLTELRKNLFIDFIFFKKISLS